MTQAGLNCRVDIYRIDFGDDDVVGGAVTTGSLQFQNILARVQANPTEPLLVQQQGLQALRTFDANVIPGTLDIRERDELEVIKPSDHVYYGDRFRIIEVRHSDFNKRDPRNYMMLQMTRSVRAHDQQ